MLSWRREEIMARRAKGPNEEGFYDQAAIVTGAGSGMGRATALALAKRGVGVAILDRNGKAADATAATITKGGGRALALATDVSKSREVDTAFRRVTAKLGPVGYLVNIAGTDGLSPLEKITDAAWADMFAVAVNGCFYATRAVLPDMMKRRFGRIVNMSSLHAVRGQAGRCHYSAAKGAIMAMSKSLAREKAAFNIRVNAVAPGPIDTPLWRAGRQGASLKRDMAQRSTVIPIGRLGQPEEIAALIIFLLSERSSYMTGALVTIDGGEIMP
jgi:NAD(P)-dependent dehydrogenase (short-subunit alcohol dehydrogenase family)